MTIYVLLKGLSEKGLVTFHGVVSSQSAAETWSAAGKSHWYWACEKTEEGDYDNIYSSPLICEVA